MYKVNDWDESDTYNVDVYAIYNEGGTFSTNDTSITAEAI